MIVSGAQRTDYMDTPAAPTIDGLLNMQKIAIPVADSARVGKVAAATRNAIAERVARYYLDRADAPQAYPCVEELDTVEHGQHEVRANAMWLGSSEALEQLGVKRGAEPTVEGLALALQGQHVISRMQVRAPGHRAIKGTKGTKDQAAHTKASPGHDEKGTSTRPAATKNEQEAVVNHYDLTFSVPKSVSVLWSQARPQARAAIEQAVMVAANAMVQQMTQTNAVVNPGGGLPREPARGYAGSVVLHAAARCAVGEAAPSPQLHAHAIILGLLRKDGRLVAIDSYEMYKFGHPLAAAAWGRLVLADQLVRMGYQVEAGTGNNARYFEVSGVPQGLIDRMSGRGKQAAQEANAYRMATGEEPRGDMWSKFALKTRQDKDRSSSHTATVRVWRGHGEDFYFGPSQTVELRGHRPYEGTLESRRKAAEMGFVARMHQRGPAVTEGNAMASAYEAACGVLRPEEAHTWIQELERSGALLALEDRRATLASIRTMERQVMEVAVRAAARPPAGLSTRALEAGKRIAQAKLGADKPMEGEQIEAFELLTGKGAWAVLTGRAGTGKGPTLHAVTAAFETDGWQVIACAVDGNTAVRLASQIGRRAYSIESVKERLRRGILTVNDRTLILVDEASKVGTKDWHMIATLVERYGARVVAVGHDGQLGAIELPGLYTQMVRHRAIPRRELKNIRRHLNAADGRIHPWLRHYQELVDTGYARQAVKLMYDNGALHLYDTREQAMAAMVAEWDGWRGRYDPDQAVMIVHGSNADVDELNVMAQERRRAVRQIGDDGVQAVDRQYRIYQGDVVSLANAPYIPEHQGPGAPGRRVENGQVGIVDSVDTARNRVKVWFRDEDGTLRRVEINQAALRERFTQLPAGAGARPMVPALRLAYARHTFPVMGATIDGTTALGGHHTQGKEATYTADTRARFRHSVHVPRSALGIDTETDEERLNYYADVYVGKSTARVASIALGERSDHRIATALPLSEPVPAFAVRPAAGQRRAIAPPEVRREDIAVADPLDRYRRVLGHDRANRIAARAQKVGRDLPGWELAQLKTRRDEVAVAFQRLDHAGAQQTLRLERNRAVLEKRLRAEVQQFEALTARARGMTRVGQRQARRDVLDAARVQRRLADEDRRELGRLRQVEQRLRLDDRSDGGQAKIRHPDDWIARLGEQAAWWIAVQYELAIRRELAITTQAEWAVGDPPNHIRAAIGDAPTLSTPEHNEWAQLTRMLERERLISQLERGHGIERFAPGSSEERRLVERIERLRAWRGLEAIAGEQILEHLRRASGVKATDSFALAS
ncbi:MAG: hypothetical protein V7607_2652 [Solirubrobacteraceae bacterium]